MTEPTDSLRRWLAQREELAGPELLLDTMSRDEVLGARATPVRAPLEPARSPMSEASPSKPVRKSVDPIESTTPEPLTPRERAAGATAPGVTDQEIFQLGNLEALRAVALGCPRCRLSETRTHVVFGEGNPDADLVIVGEAPGADEDKTGRPFVGRAGKLLDQLLASVGFPRESVFICNVLKCRPPGNRNPQPEEIAACSPYLLRQLELIQPRAILAVGTFAAQTLLTTTVGIGQLRGTVHSFRNIPLVPTYHPAALLRNPAWIRPVWEDLQRLRTIVDPR